MGSRNCVKLILLTVLPVLVGAMIYILWRPTSIRIFGWLETVGLAGGVAKLRALAEPANSYLPQWAIFSLPNGLWAFSYTVFIVCLWWNVPTIHGRLWLCSAPLIGLGYESLQFFGVIPGVFCHQDLLFCAVGIGSGFILGYLQEGEDAQVRLNRFIVLRCKTIFQKEVKL